MNHEELSYYTAKYFVKKHYLSLYEYQSYATSEFPDVLVFGTGESILFEIKTSHSDFLADVKKEARIKWAPKGYVQFFDRWQDRKLGSYCPAPQHPIIDRKLCKECSYCKDFYTKSIYVNSEAVVETKVMCEWDGGARAKWITEHPEMYYIEKPHLGSRRYFVCENKIITPEEVPKGWGLYWVKNGKFYLKVKSEKWRSNVWAEREIIVNAFRRWASGDKKGILVNAYGTIKAIGDREEALNS